MLKQRIYNVVLHIKLNHDLCAFGEIDTILGLLQELYEIFAQSHLFILSIFVYIGVFIMLVRVVIMFSIFVDEIGMFFNYELNEVRYFQEFLNCDRDHSCINCINNDLYCMS